VAGQSDVATGIRFGYASNEIGFGWTNAVFLRDREMRYRTRAAAGPGRVIAGAARQAFLPSRPFEGSHMSVPHLKRELGLFDLTLLLVVAVVNINILPRIAGEGWKALTLWVLAFVLFLVPQGVAVAYFGKKFPGEGGIYVWTKEAFGEFHAFLSGWCYWTNNLFYFPSVLFILVGILVYSGGMSSASLADSNHFVAMTSLGFLWFITLLHVRGLGVGKWLNNAGAVGTWFSLTVLVVIAIAVLNRTGSPATEFHLGALVPSFTDYGGFSAFSIVIYSLVGLELGSVMGDEIRDTSRIMGKAAFLGGLISILLYVIGTTALLIAIPAGEVGAVQGMMQAISAVAVGFHLGGLVPVTAVLISVAVLGICSAWISGAARVPFVMGVSAYLPPALGKTHPKWGTPYIALLVQGALSSGLILLSLYGTNVVEAYEKLLSSSVAIQLIPFLYLFGALWKSGDSRIWAALGFLSTAFGTVLVFVPSTGVSNPTRFVLEVFGSFAIMMGVAVLFYYLGQRKRKTLAV